MQFTTYSIGAAMPRAFLVKPRPLEHMSESRDARLTSSVDESRWRDDYDVNNNISRSSSTVFCPGLDMTTVFPAGDVARWSLAVGAGRHLWTTLESRSVTVNSQPSPLDTRQERRRDVASSAEERWRSISAPSSSSAAAAVDEDAQHFWWSTSSPQSDVSASGMLLNVLTVISYIK